MAKKFMGFKPETMAKKILPALGYDGPMDSKSIQAFLAASPAAAAKMGKYTMAARRMVEQPINAADGVYGPPDNRNPLQKFHGAVKSFKRAGGQGAGFTAAQHQAALRNFSRSISPDRSSANTQRKSTPAPASNNTFFEPSS